MAAIVNLDALIPREDFATQSEGDFERIDKIQIRDLEKGFFLSALRKPDFQRETASWGPPAVFDLVRSFVEGDLIPAVILWQSGGNVFVIDGAHRLSALIAWVQNDYGDGTLSQKPFNGAVPKPQGDIAKSTRNLINGKLGSYADHEKAAEYPDQASEAVKAHVQRLNTRAIPVQWVPGDNVKKAEKSFFTINQAGTPINKIETLILGSRGSPNALAARAIVKGGAGHKYWKSFPKEARDEIEAAAKEIHSILYDPGLELPIKTLDIPVAGQSYGAHSLPLAVDLVNLANGRRLMEAEFAGKKTKGADQKKYADDTPDGAGTKSFLDKTVRVVRRISGNSGGSLGLHPAVYFYSASGNFQPSAFLGVVTLIQELEATRRFEEFTSVRGKLETLLIANKTFISLTTHKLGSGHRSTPRVKALLMKIMDELLSGHEPDAAVANIVATPDFSYLAGEVAAEEEGPVGKKRVIRSAAFLTRALENPLRCPLCDGLLHRNSMSGDHIHRREDGGADEAVNIQMTHFYCNSEYKERAVVRTKGRSA